MNERNFGVLLQEDVHGLKKTNSKTLLGSQPPFESLPIEKSRSTISCGIPLLMKATSS